MKKFAFMGAGKMASAIIKGMIGKKIALPKEIACIDGGDDTGKKLAKETKIILAKNFSELSINANFLLLAFKPQQLNELSVEACSANVPLVISILAGVSIKKLREKFKNAGTIVRVMPNMPAQISQGVSCYSAEKQLKPKDKKLLLDVLSSIGEVLEVEEARLDAVTALSGSGPGYVFEFAHALVEAGKKIGFSEDESKLLAYKTLLGSAMLLNESSLSAKELRDSVCSKGGTTLAGLDVLMNKYKIEKALVDTLKAARDRSKELGK